MPRVAEKTVAGNLVDRWTLLTWLAVGGFMLWGAGHYTVFDDEALSCRLYTMPMGEMVRALWNGVDPDPPLYYLLENVWVHLVGVGPLALRSLSIIIFLVGLAVMRRAAEAWFDRSTGLATMILCALHPAHLFLGFAARWYSLMFLMVALLLWATARKGLGARGQRAPTVVWVLAAAGVCYTNYFGPVVVGMVWLVGLWRDRSNQAAVRHWIVAAMGALLLQAPWFLPLWRQSKLFLADGSGAASMVATAARTLMALLTGNLASVGAWWVWGPICVFAAALMVLLVKRWQQVWPMAVVVAGCFAAGTLSRTMIDKYVMTFSGPACLMVAAVLVGSLREARDSFAGRWGRAMTAGLILGWAGCGVNLIRGSHWSSLRWFDPFEQAINNLIADANAPPPWLWAMTHPSARYYCAHILMGRDIGYRFDGAGGPQDWRQNAMPPDDKSGNYTEAVGTATTVLAQLEKGPLPTVVTLETAGFVNLPDWAALHAALERSHVMTDERNYLRDPDAAWKDALDPSVRHPAYRIVVRHWVLKE